MEMPKEYAKRFVVQEELVQRPSCVVYRAIDQELGGKEVALKVFVDRPQGNKQWEDEFLQECELLRQASHLALVPIISFGVEDGWFFMAQELIGGPNLREVLKNAEGKLKFEQALAIVKDLAEGLHEIHEKGKVHGHIDTRAVLFKGEKARLAGYYPVVMSKIQKSMTSDGRLVVNPSYIAPEQVDGSGSITGKADIFALSVMFYELLTGQKPFQASNPLQTAMLRLTQSAPSPAKLCPGLSPLVDAAILKGLAKDPAQRFANMLDFVDAITGGKLESKNPLADAVTGADRMSTETIAVSMSTDAIKAMLRAHDAEQRQKVAPPLQPKERSASAPASSGVAPGSMLTEQGDSAATMMGMDVSKVLRGSFIVLEGARRGQKFMIDKNQIMIGSDAGCDVVVEGKGVPARYAIVVQRGEQFLAAALSPTGLNINGQNVAGMEETAIQRGDVLAVGAEKLRFVAPGEVFTLSDDVADRVIDRPKSKMPIIVGSLTVVVLVVVGYMVYSYKATSEAQRAARARHQADTQLARGQKIDEFRREGDEFFKAGALMEPVGNNAQTRFQQILEMDPENTYAKRRLSEIDARIQQINQMREQREAAAAQIQRLIAEGDRAFQNGDYIAPPGSNAKELYQNVLRLDPENALAKEKIEEVNNIMRDAVSKVQEMLTQAHQFIEQGQYVLPREANAYDLLQKVLKIDPGNREARETLYEIAAKSIFMGDQARSRADAKEMRRFYVTGQAMGVDPEFVQKRMKGAELISKSKGSAVIIYNAGEDEKPKDADKKQQDAGRYLDTKEIERRVAEMALKSADEGASSERRFINMGR